MEIAVVANTDAVQNHIKDAEHVRSSLTTDNTQRKDLQWLQNTKRDNKHWQHYSALERTVDAGMIARVQSEQ